MVYVYTNRAHSVSVPLAAAKPRAWLLSRLGRWFAALIYSSFQAETSSRYARIPCSAVQPTYARGVASRASSYGTVIRACGNRSSSDSNECCHLFPTHRIYEASPRGPCSAYTACDTAGGVVGSRTSAQSHETWFRNEDSACTDECIGARPWASSLRTSASGNVCPLNDSIVPPSTFKRTNAKLPGQY